MKLVESLKTHKIKTEYCNKKGIKLYRIKYTDNIKDSINDILDYIKNNF